VGGARDCPLFAAGKPEGRKAGKQKAERQKPETRNQKPETRNRSYTMALSAFDDKSHPPTEKELAEVLGKTHSLWIELRDHVASAFAPLTVEWGCSSKSTGWGLRLKTEKRAVLYLCPCRGYFLASFALGEKAVCEAKEAGLPDSVLKTIEDAPRYAEGRGVRFEVRTRADVRNMEKLAAVKMAN
jgi:hypothetical protein